MVAPESLLKPTSVLTLKIGVYRAFLDADQIDVEYDPSSILNNIDKAVLRVVQHFPSPPPVNFRQTSGVVAAVRSVIDSEMIYGRFHGATDPRELYHAIEAVILDMRIRLEDRWLYGDKGLHNIAPVLPSVIVPLTANIAANAPGKILSKVFAYLSLLDLARASRTCRCWRRAALHPANEHMRARAVPQGGKDAEDCPALSAIDTLAGARRVTLHAWLVPEAILYVPAIRLVRPSEAMFARALAALPRAELLWVRVHDAGAMSFTIGTASGYVRECVDVRWDFWGYVRRDDDTLWYRVRDVAVPNPTWRIKELVAKCFPHAMTPATRRKHGRGNLDSAGEAVHLPEPQDPIRLLWPYGKRSKSAPASSVPDDDGYVDDGFLDFLDPGSDSDLES